MAKDQEWKITANKKRTRSLISNGLTALFEVHSEVAIAQHLVSIMRSKGKVVGKKPDGTPIYRDFYSIDDQEFLKDMEAYTADLERIKTGEDD